MSFMNYDGPSRFSRVNSARTFPEVYYSERNIPLDYSRADHYAYQMGGPVNGLRNRPQLSREEYPLNQEVARRRIAVACARCRKRKIRCSGPVSDGQGCHNCNAAGVEAGQCQFHRVGSDSVHNMMDKRDSLTVSHTLANMTSDNSNNMMPLYSVRGNGPYYRSVQSHPYERIDAKPAYAHLDAKLTYGNDWLASCEEDSSPTENYSFDQSASYMPTPPQPAGSNTYSLPYRCTQPTVRTHTAAANHYSDYGQTYTANGLPYLQTDVRPDAHIGPISPLNMSSLQSALPGGPGQRQLQPTEVPLTPRRQLPTPQRKPGYALHHALDQQQDQRLRSSQTIATPSFSNATPAYTNTGSYTKPPQSWSATDGDLATTMSKAGATAMPPPTTPHKPADATESPSTYFPSGRTADDVPNTTEDAVSSNTFNFSTLPLLDPFTIAPTPPAYSNFRESRDFSASTPTAQITRNDSSSSLYTYAFDDASRRQSLSGSGSSSNLVSGRQYTPLSQSASTSKMENLTRESFGAQAVPMRRASASDFNTSF